MVYDCRIRLLDFFVVCNHGGINGDYMHIIVGHFLFEIFHALKKQEKNVSKLYISFHFPLNTMARTY